MQLRGEKKESGRRWGEREALSHVQTDVLVWRTWQHNGGTETGKGEAVTYYLQVSQNQWGDITTIAVGDTPLWLSEYAISISCKIKEEILSQCSVLIGLIGGCSSSKGAVKNSEVDVGFCPLIESKIIKRWGHKRMESLPDVLGSISHPTVPFPAT